MCSTSLQWFGIRRNVFVFVFTIFNVGLYGLYVMDIQGDKSDVNLAPMRQYKVSIVQPEHQTYFDYDDHEEEELKPRPEPTIQSISIERSDPAHKTAESLLLHKVELRTKPKIQSSMEFNDRPHVSSGNRDIPVTNTKMDEIQQNIQNTQGTWIRSSRKTSFDKNEGHKDSKIPSEQSVLKKTSAIGKLSSKQQDSSLIKRTSSGKNSFQNSLPLEESYPKQEDTTSGNISLPKCQAPCKSSAKTFVTSSSRNRSTKKQLSLDKRAWQNLTEKKGSEKTLFSGKSSLLKDAQFEMNNLEEITPLKSRKSVTEVKSRPEKEVSPALLGDILKDNTAQEDGPNAAAASSYNKVVKDPRNATADGILNVYYGRKILSSNFSIVYNAVPKCGSRTLQVAVINLRKRTGKRLKQFTNIPPPSNCPTDDENSSCFHSFYTSMPPLSFVRPHFPFVSLPSNYVMINMIRDPLERFISLFFFRIYGDGEIAGLGVKKQSIDDCVQSGNAACDPLSTPSAITFMCGVEPACRKATRWALEKAKRNVERYLVVGYLEDIDSMIKVLEVLVPNQLRGLYDQYVSQKNASRRFKTKQKEPLSPETISILNQKLTLHYEFYNFIRAKFDRLKESLGIR